MSDLDGLRWMWAARISDDLVSWASLWAPSDMEFAPGVRGPLPLAWIVARTARVLTDADGTDPIAAIGPALPIDPGYPSAEAVVEQVGRALSSVAWPARLPADPRATELLYSELWSAARSRELSSMALHRELAQRWEIRDPRMLNYLSGLGNSPFAGYIDFRDVLLEDAESEATRLLMFLWNKLEPESHTDAYPGMPSHLARLAVATYAALRVEHNIQKFAPGWDPEVQAAAETALEMVKAHRTHIADVMNDFTGYEVDLIRSAVFGDRAA